MERTSTKLIFGLRPSYFPVLVLCPSRFIVRAQHGLDNGSFRFVGLFWSFLWFDLAIRQPVYIRRNAPIQNA